MSQHLRIARRPWPASASGWQKDGVQVGRVDARGKTAVAHTLLSAVGAQTVAKSTSVTAVLAPRRRRLRAEGTGTTEWSSVRACSYRLDDILDWHESQASAATSAERDAATVTEKGPMRARNDRRKVLLPTPPAATWRLATPRPASIAATSLLPHPHAGWTPSTKDDGATDCDPADARTCPPCCEVDIACAESWSAPCHPRHVCHGRTRLLSSQRTPSSHDIHRHAPDVPRRVHCYFRAAACEQELFLRRQ